MEILKGVKHCQNFLIYKKNIFIKQMNKEKFCPLCVAAPLALASGGGSVAKDNEKEEKKKKMYNIFMWISIVLTILMVIWWLYKKKKGCSTCLI